MLLSHPSQPIITNPMPPCPSAPFTPRASACTHKHSLLHTHPHNTTAQHDCTTRLHTAKVCATTTSQSAYKRIPLKSSRLPEKSCGCLRETRQNTPEHPRTRKVHKRMDMHDMRGAKRKVCFKSESPRPCYHGMVPDMVLGTT